MTKSESSSSRFRDIPVGSRVPPDLARDLLERAGSTSAPVEAKQKRPKSEKREKGKVTLAEAKEIMRTDFIGPDELRSIFIGLEIKDVPPIPFSNSELKEAQERGEFLMLRTDMLPDGKHCTMQNLHENFKDNFVLLYSTTDEWKLKSTFFTEEKPSLSWALVSKEVIPTSTSKNYYEQTLALRDHLKNIVYKGAVPREYEEAIQGFEAWMTATFPGKTMAEIKTELGGEKWEKYAESLANLKINQLCRQSAVEALFDLAVYYKHSGTRLLPNRWTWTNSRDSDGGLVRVGSLGADGAIVDRSRPVSSSSDLGVLLSRTA